MTKRIAFVAITVLAASLLIFTTGCNRASGGGQADTRNSGSGEQMIRDRAAFSASLATPLSAEDQAIWDNIEQRSNNPSKVVMRVGTVIRNWDEHPAQRSARQWAIEVKKLLGDRVEFQFFWNGSLGVTADQILGGLQARTNEVSDYNVGAFAEYTRAFLPLDVMYLIPDVYAGLKVTEGEPGEIMRQRCIDDTGLLVLFYTNIGMRHTTNSRRPIRTPQDMQGLKIRVQNNPLHILAVRQLGAAPTPIAYAELFTALQQRVVDGQENPISNIYDQNYAEVQSHMTLTNHMYTAGTVVINNNWFREQSAEVQQAILSAARIAEAYTATETIKVEQALLGELSKGMAMHELTPEQFNQFRDISMQTWDQAAERIGKDYFEQVRTSIERTLVN